MHRNNRGSLQKFWQHPRWVLTVIVVVVVAVVVVVVVVVVHQMTIEIS